jgi:dTDP-4-dehydrorhamnose 3,5-epimerase
MNKPAIIPGGIFTDHRGIIQFANDFKFDNIKRFYTITHKDVSSGRAWQGHKTEKKYFFPVQGIFQIAWVKIDDWEKPSNNLVADNKILKASNPEILHIPEGYANGFKALEENSILLVYSNLELEESSTDIYRYNKDLWFNWD